MIEVILGVWALSFLLSLVTVAVNFQLIRKKLASEELSNLNSHLEKVGLYWSNTTEDFLPLQPEAIKKDKERTLRNALLMIFLALGSLPGFILLFVLVLSIHFLAPSRKTTATFKSSLTKPIPLSQDEIENLVKQLSKIY